MSPTREAVLEVIASEALIPVSKLTPEATLESLGIASLDMISILFSLEDKYGIILEPADLQGLTTLGDLVDFVLLKSKAA